MTERIYPTEATPYIYDGRESKDIFHTDRCTIVQKLDRTKFEKATEEQVDRFEECKQCAGISPNEQRGSYAKKLRSGKLEMTSSVEDDEIKVEKVP